MATDLTDKAPALRPARLPYHPKIEELFGIDRAGWTALVEAVFPAAQETQSVILALSYCRARKLDVFKRNVHIVPIWDKAKGKMVDTIWPGIGELRTTAFRTTAFAGCDDVVFGPDATREWETKEGKVTVTFPEWAKMTVYRMVKGERVAFAGPRVYWAETYSTSGKSDVPNSMWQDRPRGQLEKCAEAAALRRAFPEELGDEITSDESGLAQRINTVLDQRQRQIPQDVAGALPPGASKSDQVAELLKRSAEAEEEAVSEPQPEPEAEQQQQQTETAPEKEPDFR